MASAWITTLCPDARSASPTVDTCLATLFDRRTAIGLPGPEPADEPATTVAELVAASSATSGGSTWSSGSALPSDGTFCGVTTTTRLAWVAGCPVVLRNPDEAEAASIVCALLG